MQLGRFTDARKTGLCITFEGFVITPHSASFDNPSRPDAFQIQRCLRIFWGTLLARSLVEGAVETVAVVDEQDLAKCCILYRML